MTYFQSRPLFRKAMVRMKNKKEITKLSHVKHSETCVKQASKEKPKVPKVYS